MRCKASHIILFLILSTGFLSGQDTASGEYAVDQPDPNTVRPLPEEEHRRLIEQLNYEGEPPPPPDPKEEERKRRIEEDVDNWLDRWNQKRKIGPIELSNGAFYLILLILLLGLGYFIYNFLDDRVLKRTKAEEKAGRVDIEEIKEEQLSFRETESLLARAERNEQFALAVRLQYLALLKQLDELELIQFKKDKINRDYIYEMDETELSDDFFQLTTDFERNWYGQYPIDRLSYRLIASKFTAFRNRLESLQKPAEYAS
ncbi:MAG: hypothetical protein AAFU03_09205 [Bacteroidota bacterium]